MSTFAIVLPTFHRPHTLPRTLEMLKAQTHRPWWCFIVYHESDDEARYIANNSELIGVHGVDYHDEPSASAQRNAGLRHIMAMEAHPHYLIFCDDDDIIEPAWLEEFALAFRDAPPECEMVQCLIENHDGQVMAVGATPCNAIRFDVAKANWGDEHGYHSDRAYFAQYTLGAVIPKVLVKAGYEMTGGLRHPEGRL